MIDTHCHLDFPPFAGKIRRVLAEAAEVGVTEVINPGTSWRSSQYVVELATDYSEVWAAVGTHPTEKEGISFEQLTDWRELASHRRVVAIGEVGLDYHHARVHPEDTPSIHDQKVLFEQFIMIAEEVGKPLIIHAREAHLDALALVQEISGTQPMMIFHSFDGAQDVARQLLDAGAYIGLNNLLTYPKNEDLRQVAAWAPLDRLLLETDGPFLPPQNRRGGEATPADVVPVAQLLAELHHNDLAQVDAITTRTARAIFALQ